MKRMTLNCIEFVYYSKHNKLALLPFYTVNSLRVLFEIPFSIYRIDSLSQNGSPVRQTD